MRRRPSSSLLSLLALVPLACGRGRDEEGAVPGVDLLARSPDSVLEQPGVLVADDEDGWRPHGQFGWERWPDGRRVWSSRTSAFLNLPACEPRERMLALTLRGPDGEQRSLRVTLNGVALGEVPLTEDREVRRLVAPAPAWHPGENLLELSVAELAELEPGRRVGFALSRLEYDRPARVRIRTGRVELTAGTSVGYRIEPLSPGQVLLRGSADGEGRVLLAFRALDRVRGEAREVQSTLVTVSGDGLERRFPLPDVGGELLELSLAWEGEPESTFELTSLRLEEEQPRERVPILFISIDTLAARHLSLQGFSLPTTPELERLAREAVVFERCLANAPWTLPSYMSLWSGLPPLAHRLPTVGEGHDLWELWYLASNRWTLPESLRASGYLTAGFVDNFWLTERFGLAQGFELYDSTASDNEKTDPDGGIRAVLADARDFLEERDPGEPWFLFLHAFDVHGPYAPPRGFAGRFAQAGPYDAERTERAGGPSDAYDIIASYIARGAVPRGPLPERLPTAPLARAYDEGIAMVDAELGSFFDWLDERGILEQVLVIVTADHGETVAGERYLFGHGTLDEETVHVPLIVRFPGGSHGGRRIAEPVQLLDLYPTLLDWIGSHASRETLSGRSLLPLLEGGCLAPAPILCESGSNLRQAALYAGSWKLLEQEPCDASRAVALTLDPLTPGWLEATERRLRAKRAPDSLFAWKEDRELVLQLVEELPRTGLTEECLARMRQRPGFESLLQMLRRAQSEPRYLLFDLEADPLARRDLAAEQPARTEELKRLLDEAQQGRDAARETARLPTQPVELSAEDIDALDALGYSGGGK